MLIYKVCDCGNEYKVYSNREASQAICPTCRSKRDVEHGRKNAVVINRKKIWDGLVKIESHPGQWREMSSVKSNSDPYWKLEAKGVIIIDDVEAPIIINSSRGFPQIGDTYFIRVMEVKKEKDGTVLVHRYTAIEGSDGRSPEFIMREIDAGLEITSIQEGFNDYDDYDDEDLLGASTLEKIMEAS